MAVFPTLGHLHGGNRYDDPSTHGSSDHRKREGSDSGLTRCPRHTRARRRVLEKGLAKTGMANPSGWLTGFLLVKESSLV
jgi:hypothetical protein